MHVFGGSWRKCAFVVPRLAFTTKNGNMPGARHHVDITVRYRSFIELHSHIMYCSCLFWSFPFCLYLRSRELWAQYGFCFLRIFHSTGQRTLVVYSYVIILYNWYRPNNRTGEISASRRPWYGLYSVTGLTGQVPAMSSTGRSKTTRSANVQAARAAKIGNKSKKIFLPDRFAGQPLLRSTKRRVLLISETPARPAMTFCAKTGKMLEAQHPRILYHAHYLYCKLGPWSSNL